MTSDQKNSRAAYDAILVGGGHNGLTAAAYLARAGLSTLVLERRPIVGGACVTEEIAPGCRASTTSYIASMLRPEVIRDLDLARHGLQMVPCDPALLVPFPDGTAVPWWSERDRTVAELARLSPADAKTFVRVDDELKRLARYLQPFFLEPPPDVGARGWTGLLEALRVGKRFRGISATEIGRMVAFLTGSLGDFLDRNYESEKVKTLFLANNVYGKHGGPYSPGTALGLLFHLLSGGEHEIQGFYGHVLGGMGSITQAMAAAARGFGAEILTDTAVASIDVRDGRARGVVLEDGREIRASVVVSNADPKRTFLGLVAARELAGGVPLGRRGHQDGRPLREGQFRAVRRAGASPACPGSSRSRSAPSPPSCRLSSSPSAATTSRGRASFRRSSGSTASSRRTSTRRSRPRGATS